MTSPPQSNHINNSPNPWAVFTSCSDDFQVDLSENPSKIGPTLNNGLIILKDDGYCEIAHQGNFNYYIKVHNTQIKLNGKLLEKEHSVKIESGSKISFEDKNQNIHRFVFSSRYKESLDEDLQELLTCSICCEIFYKCFILMDCSHRFCEACIMESLQQQQFQQAYAQEPKHVQLCPFCKQTFNNFQRDLKLNDLCEEFLKRPFVKHLSEDQKRKRDNLETYTRFYDVNHDTYIGYWRGAKRHGNGKMIFGTGNKFEGIFKNNSMEIGTMIYRDGPVYTGTFKNKKKHGEGIETIYSNGIPIEYTGTFFEDKKHGEGTLTFKGQIQSNILSIQAQFIEDIPKEKGRILYRDGSCYDGGFCRNNFKRNGFGKMKFPNRSIYEGGWKEDRMHGDGAMFYQNGNIYTGTWSEGVALDEGGEMIFSNGNDHIDEHFVPNEKETDLSDAGTYQTQESEDLTESQNLSEF